MMSTRPFTPAEHYRLAEAEIDQFRTGVGVTAATFHLQLAQVHATLATVTRDTYATASQTAAMEREAVAREETQR
jgi:hypothetical protein